MKAIGSDPIWNEPFGELVLRWISQQPNELRYALGPGAEVQLRIEKRAARILDASKLEPARPLATPREWESRWVAHEQWERLVAHLAARGWKTHREPGVARGQRWAPSVLGQPDDQIVVISSQAIADMQGMAKESGLLLSMTEDDWAVVALAQEIYRIEAARLGNPAVEWTEQLASHEFTRRLLGLPFHPLVLSLLEEHE